MENLNFDERLEDDVTNTDCRTEVYKFMSELIAKLGGRGWSEVEITVALADAADEHVMLLAKSKPGASH
ncbi:hypothetical protein LAV84_22830 [Rhizobium sp. VS19-DR104.2]|uniref:hypothetical protein n=1 Tax=unclassified Rhizobium TaxID=2613769 RepID=UPI001ADBA7E6|nr:MULTISPECIES: hypothetical protein [unclassified Rhizobium]MBO9135163.1 hypothetical protein [Rhizobium sp. B209b/85]MBZ5761934.1 hypothetical protein [Rhizobium sp. VS19-DR96]MBZ5768906.1 hypothetical protein [Rhizobium sp. VS19-DR129.2]MBZ5775690.1 hypothetical protein [Rhizobium sp. VS19-DRK62.2]MBZ5786812.1 hypothetical protein [Rhizobium sp. VS19-DR121]